jgi:flagellar hook-basal body complex protein FliE
MSTSIQGVGVGAGVTQLGAGAPGRLGLGEGPVGSFKDTLAQALGEVQGAQESGNDAVAAFLRGDPVELHDVMAAVEEAGLALEMLIEVRNQVVDAYRTVVNMQS